MWYKSNHVTAKFDFIFVKKMRLNIENVTIFHSKKYIFHIFHNLISNHRNLYYLISCFSLNTLRRRDSIVCSQLSLNNNIFLKFIKPFVYYSTSYWETQARFKVIRSKVITTTLGCYHIVIKVDCEALLVAFAYIIHTCRKSYICITCYNSIKNWK